MPKKGKNWPKGMSRQTPSEQGETSAQAELDEIDQAIIRLNALHEFRCTLCARTYGSLRTLTTHDLIEQEFTLNAVRVTRRAPSPPRSMTLKPPPMSTVSSVVDPYECLQSDLAVSSSSSDVTTTSRPETPAVFTVNDDSEVEEGEIREGPDVTNRHIQDEPMEAGGTLETAPARPTHSSNQLDEVIAAVAHQGD